jgi:hypothetical protein
MIVSTWLCPEEAHKCLPDRQYRLNRGRRLHVGHRDLSSSPPAQRDGWVKLASTTMDVRGFLPVQHRRQDDSWSQCHGHDLPLLQVAVSRMDVGHCEPLGGTQCRLTYGQVETLSDDVIVVRKLELFTEV